MKTEELELYAVKGVISFLPPEEREKCEALIAKFKTLIDESGALGLVALAYVGLEMQSKTI